MIFKPELAEKVMAGEKTVTRRVPSDNPNSPWFRDGCKLKVDGYYAVQPGRSKHSIGRVWIQSVDLVPLGYLTEEEARAEGFDTVADFEDLWAEMHDGYAPAQEVWRVTFRLVARFQPQPLSEHLGTGAAHPDSARSDPKNAGRVV